MDAAMKNYPKHGWVVLVCCAVCSGIMYCSPLFSNKWLNVQRWVPWSQSALEPPRPVFIFMQILTI